MGKDKGIAKENREAVREALRKEGKEKRASVRAKVRAAAVMAVACLSLACLYGCATATPSSKAQTSKACGNTITVNIALVAATNSVAVAALPSGFTISLSDLIGTQVQSADAGRDDSNTQTASPANTSGITGDKPIDTIGEVGKAALTYGASAAAAKAAKLVSGTADTNTAAAAAEKAAEACTTGNCNLTK